MLNFLIFEKMFSKSIETNETEKKKCTVLERNIFQNDSSETGRSAVW